MRRRDALLLLGAAPLRAQEPIFDLLIRRGEVFDPGASGKGRLDIGIVGDRIAKIAPSLPASRARLVIDAEEYTVTPGLIDLRARCDPGRPGGVHADHHALRNGVTTVIDAGSATAEGFAAAHERMSEAHTRVLCWLHVSEDADAGASVRAAREHTAAVAGVWAPRAADLAKARQVAAAAGKPLLTASPGAAALQAGEIQTQAFAREAAVVDAKRKLRPEMAAARKRGVRFDTGDLWFRIAGPAIEQGFLPDTISTNLTIESVQLPRADMMTTLSKLINLGMTLPDVLARVTASAAAALGQPELGTLREGGQADVALLALEPGPCGFLDMGHARLTGSRSLRCALTIRAGKAVWDPDGLVSADWQHTGPYTNFR
ncbi:MAG: hypothetical protein IPM24_15080 [Bryobacterales bacterium]|nr:hypothetical protein [Bryobacterales bacterium]